MNILFINSARTWGGTEKWVRMAAESLSASHEVSLVYRTPVIGNNFSIRKYQLPCVSHIDPYTLLRIVTIIKNEKLNILIPTKRKDYVLAGLAAKICGIHNVLRLGIDRKLRLPFFHKLMYHDLADGIIVNAEQTRRSLLQSPFMQNDRIKVIYNGLDTRLMDEDTSPCIQKPAAFLITAMGILTRRKGFDFLIRGFARFVKNNPDADTALAIIGEGPHRKALITLSRELGLSRKIHFTGFLKKPFGWLKQSDIFAMTSQNEGIPNALLEAMYLYNTPVCTPAGGTTEVIRNEENGFLVDYDNEKQLAHILQRLFLDRHLTQVIANKAHHRVREQFSIEAMSRNIEVFCREISSKKKDTRPT